MVGHHSAEPVMESGRMESGERGAASAGSHASEPAHVIEVSHLALADQVVLDHA